MQKTKQQQKFAKPKFCNQKHKFPFLSNSFTVCTWNRGSDGAEAEEGAGEAAGADGRDADHHRVPAGRAEERAGQPAGPANHEERLDGPEEGA